MDKIKKRYFDKVYDNAEIIECKCGCGNKIKNKDRYGRDKKYISGHNGRKYKDPKQHKREWNYRNKARMTEYRKKTRRERKGKLIIYLGGECKDCGISYDKKNACIFDFHHLREKCFGVSGNVMEKSMEKLKLECDKCELVCSNCHRIRHREEDY